MTLAPHKINISLAITSLKGKEIQPLLSFTFAFLCSLLFSPATHLSVCVQGPSGWTFSVVRLLFVTPVSPSPPVPRPVKTVSAGKTQHLFSCIYTSFPPPRSSSCSALPALLPGTLLTLVFSTMVSFSTPTLAVHHPTTIPARLDLTSLVLPFLLTSASSCGAGLTLTLHDLGGLFLMVLWFCVVQLRLSPALLPLRNFSFSSLFIRNFFSLKGLYALIVTPLSFEQLVAFLLSLFFFFGRVTMGGWEQDSLLSIFCSLNLSQLSSVHQFWWVNDSDSIY